MQSQYGRENRLNPNAENCRTADATHSARAGFVTYKDRFLSLTSPLVARDNGRRSLMSYSSTFGAFFDLDIPKNILCRELFVYLHPHY